MLMNSAVAPSRDAENDIIRDESEAHAVRHGREVMLTVAGRPFILSRETASGLAWELVRSLELLDGRIP